MAVSPSWLSPTETWMSARSWASGRSSVSLGHDSTVLAMAVLAGDNIDQVRALINIGVVMSDQHPWVLYQACLQGLDLIQALLASSDTSFNVNIPDEAGDSILHFVLRTPASRFDVSKSQIVEFLCNNGADPFGRDRLSETALHILAGQPGGENLELLQNVLYNSGSGSVPYINHRSHYGDTALAAAILSHNIPAIRLLLEFGADPSAEGDLGGNAAHYAFQLGNLEVLGLLQAYGAQLDDNMQDASE